MNCYVPGRVVVGPGPEFSDGRRLGEILGEEFGAEFEYELGVEDVLRANDLASLEGTKSSARQLPFIARVPEGAELEMAGRLQARPRWEVASVVPDFLVRPSGFSIDESVLDMARMQINGNPNAWVCGSGTRVGIVDSGLDPNWNVSHVPPVRLDAYAPLNQLPQQADNTGHGTLIATIVAEMVPSATIVSVKAFDNVGSISSVLAGLYLANASAPCDVINLSLALSCDADLCQVCGQPHSSTTNADQLRYFFRTFSDQYPDTVMIAAAGNTRTHLAMPAAFEGVIAVGSFDYTANTPTSNYLHVPMERYLLAPGGAKGLGSAFGQRTTLGSPEYFFGTSFSAAFVSGLTARLACSFTGRCFAPAIPSTPIGMSRLECVLAELGARTDKSWPSYDIHRHGLGALSF